MQTDDANQFGYAVVLTVAVDLLTRLAAVEEAVYSLVVTPALALQTAFTRSLAAMAVGIDQLAPLAATISAVLGLYLYSRWRWHRA